MSVLNTQCVVIITLPLAIHFNPASPRPQLFIINCCNTLLFSNTLPRYVPPSCPNYVQMKETNFVTDTILTHI